MLKTVPTFDKVDGLIGMHIIVGLPDPLLDGIVLVDRIVPELPYGFVRKIEFWPQELGGIDDANAILILQISNLKLCN